MNFFTDTVNSVFRERFVLDLPFIGLLSNESCAYAQDLFAIYFIFIAFTLRVCAYSNPMSADNERTPFNLSIDKEVKRQMKIACAESAEDVSDVTEELYREFLKRHAAGKRVRYSKGRKR